MTMSGVQRVNDQDTLPHHCDQNEETHDEDPEHQLTLEEPGGTLQEQVLLQANGDTEAANLDSEAFTKALEDVELRRDLRRACQRAFMKYRQSTHGSWEDLAQEVLIRYGQWLPNYRKEANARTIFEKIATNVLIDAKRRETAQRRFHEEIELDELQPDIVGNNPWNGIETRIFLNECSSSLSDKERGILHEHYVEGRSLRQMATNHGVSAPAISKKLERILTKLSQRQHLQRMSTAEAA
jgi:RNA polymerase sigma factor (sigma-70 family)